MAKANLLYSYQQRHVQNPSRFTWLNWSRQTGKSHATTLRRIIRGMNRRRNQIFLSASERQSRELMMKAQTHIRAMKIAFDAVEGSFHDPLENVTYKSMEIVIPAIKIAAGGLPMRVIGLPANPSTARGYTGDVLLDEFAMHKHAREVYAAVFPSVARDNGELDVCSTPQGRQNVFYAMKDMDVFHHDTLTILDAVAQGCPQDPQVLRSGCPDEETWRQEFMCEFVDEATAFLTFELIGECEDQTLPLHLDVGALASLKGDCVAGIDIGRKHDLTVVWVFEVADRTLRSRGMIEVRSMPFHEQFELLSKVINCNCVRRVAVDATGLGMQLAQDLELRFGSYTVEPCTMTAPFKEQIASRMRNRFLDRTIRIPVSSDVRNDLHSIRKTVTRAGNVRLDAPREGGSHADRFWAAALACHAGAEGVGPIEVAGMGPAPWSKVLRGDDHRHDATMPGGRIRWL